MRIRLLATLALLPVLPSCTPLGLWVYEDPSMALRQATTVRPAGGGLMAGGSLEAGDSLEMVLVGCNLNDYDLTGESVRSRLTISGRTVAEGFRDGRILLATRDTSRFSVSLPMPEVLRSADATPLPFELLVASRVQTPLGERDLTYSLRGVVQRSGGNLAWRVEVGKSCRPGGSALPNQFERTVPIDLRKD